MEQVYLVVKGENYEGYNVMEVFSTIEKAKTYVQDHIRDDNNISRKKWEKIDEVRHERGCDYIEIITCEVD